MPLSTLAPLFLASLLAQDAPAIDPPPVDEAALAARLLAMAQPVAGERAVIVFDPTYYPGITTRLRESLQALGVQTATIADDTPAMVASYSSDDPTHDRRERDVIETWLPVFERSDIFYWMPTRGYGNDLRWETLTARSRVRSVHFHWLLPFPGARTASEIADASRSTQTRALEVDLDAHARDQRRLAAALRGRTIRITTPAGTDLSVALRRDEWFHFGNGDASRAGTAAARWLRDRMIELPVGMFQFVPDPETVSGTLAVPVISQAGSAVRDARLQLTNGRIADVAAASGADWIRERTREVGPDGDRIGLVSFNTNPRADQADIVVDIGANWEHGATNRATRMWRMSIRLSQATVTVDGRAVVRDGRIQWSVLDQR
jgi:hypothetical protein